MKTNDLELPAASADRSGPPDLAVGLTDLLIWLGEGKRLIATVTVAVAVISLGAAMQMTPIYTARATMLAPGSQQQSGSAAALAALGSLGGLAGGVAPKSPDELYVALLKSDSVERALAEKFHLMERYKVATFESLRRLLPSYIRIAPDKKSGLISIEVDDPSADFAAELANGHAPAVAELLGRLAVSEAQMRRAFFETQLRDTKENLIKAEQNLLGVQEKSGVIVLDKQAEALIGGAAQLRAQITEREVQLKVLRTSATDQNPDVMRMTSELSALRAELARMQSSQGGASNNPVEIPVGRIPAASIDYVRARRELKLQETLLESMVRQYEIAKLDEAKEGPALQQVDIARPPDYKSKPSRALIVIVSTLIALLATSAFVVVRRYARLAGERDPESAAAWQALRGAWRWRRS